MIFLTIYFHLITGCQLRSGTGYLSAIAAVLGGPTSLNHGIEVFPSLLQLV